jgi:hypothetical protein
MKHIPVIFRIALLIAVLASLAACSGGAFIDPGRGAGGASGGNGTGTGTGTGGNGVSKPATLSTSASYNQALAKLNEIIEYCEDNPGTQNDGMKSGAQTWKTTFSTYASTWGSSGPTVISSINDLIDQLQ